MALWFLKCIRTPLWRVFRSARARSATEEVPTFGATTRDLEALRDWLWQAGATNVGMESGHLLAPFYAFLEGHFDLIVGNAQHIRNMPGPKTDAKESEWIADLVRHGLIANSFVALAGSARFAALSPQAGGKPAAERNPLLKLLYDRQYHADERRQRRLRRARPRDDPGADRGRDLGRGGWPISPKDSFTANAQI
jgi:hypothetical protein